MELKQCMLIQPMLICEASNKRVHSSLTSQQGSKQLQESKQANSKKASLGLSVIVCIVAPFPAKINASVWGKAENFGHPHLVRSTPRAGSFLAPHSKDLQGHKPINIKTVHSQRHIYIHKTQHIHTYIHTYTYIHKCVHVNTSLLTLGGLISTTIIVNV